MYIREPDFELFLRLTSCQRQYYVFTTVVIYRLSVLIYVFLFIELYTCFFFLYPYETPCLVKWIRLCRNYSVKFSFLKCIQCSPNAAPYRLQMFYKRHGQRKKKERRLHREEFSTLKWTTHI